MQVKTKYELPIRTETIAFVLLAGVALLLRLNHLSADPPPVLSTSQGVFTDPAQYTSFARNLVLWGTFNPLHDYRLIFFLKSMTTVVSYLVFKIAGIGYLQSNFVGLVFSFPTIILLYFALRRAAGNIAALIFLIFISVDYNQIFYGRLSFLENSMNFFAILSFAILIYGRRVYAFALAGIFLGLGIFFGKIIGLIYLFPFACYVVYIYFHDYRPDFKTFVKRYAFFAFGFLAVLVSWYFFSYRPMAASVTGYVQEQAFGLYGAPDALKSFDTFVYKYVSLGAKSRLFPRLVIPALLAWGMITIFFFRAGFKEAWKNKLSGITPGILFLVALVIVSYGSLMIWNYRPLRYQTMLIYPVCALAGVFASTLICGSRTDLSRRGYLLFPLIFFVFSLIPIYQLMGPVYNMFGSPYYFVTARLPLFIVSIAVTATVVVFMRHAPYAILSPPGWFKGIFILAAGVLAVVPNSAHYLQWSSGATFSTVASSKDLSTLLSPEAVISGPYAADFTLENNLRHLIHMFGVATVDSAFFRKYPITHLLLDKSNQKYARENYPEIMEKATVLVRYHLPGRSINLYRVAGVTGNIAADNYQLSDFEMGLFNYSHDDIEAGHSYMKSHLAKHPDNLSANLASGNVAVDNGFYDEAEFFYKKAIEFSPTDFHLRFKLGEFYIRMYKKTNVAELKDKALAEFKKAIDYNPTSAKLVRDIDQLLRDKGRVESE